MKKCIKYQKQARYPQKYKTSILNGTTATTIGFNYYCGKDGFPLNKNMAFKYFSMGADLGCPEATWIIGYLYLTGDVVEQNIKKGISILEKECKKNNLIALAYMSKYYEYGHYVKVDTEKAIRYYLKIKMIGDMNIDRYKDHSDYINASKKLFKYFYDRKEYRNSLFMLNGLKSDFWKKYHIWLIKNRLNFKRKHESYNQISLC